VKLPRPLLQRYNAPAAAMFDFRSIGDWFSARIPEQLREYIPYIDNTYFLLFAISSILYAVTRAPSAAASRPLSRTPVPAIPPADAASAACSPAASRIPFLRSVLAFIMYNLLAQLTLCITFFALGSQHSAQRIFGAGTVALHLASGGTLLLVCFLLLGAMILLGICILLTKYSAAYISSLAREYSLWCRGDGRQNN
jgi:hypothetical protein